ERLVLVDAGDVDDRIAAFALGAVLQRHDGAEEGDLARFLVGLVRGVGLLVRGPFADLLPYLGRALVAEIKADARIDLFLVALALGERRLDRELQPLVTRKRRRRNGHGHHAREREHSLFHPPAPSSWLGQLFAIEAERLEHRPVADGEEYRVLRPGVGEVVLGP